MFFVYLLANGPYGTLYVGTTSDLLRRIWEHKNKVVPGFTKKYGVDRLVRGARFCRGGASPREANQAVEAGLEDQPDRARKPWLERLVSDAEPITPKPTPAKAEARRSACSELLAPHRFKASRETRRIGPNHGPRPSPGWAIGVTPAPASA